MFLKSGVFKIKKDVFFQKVSKNLNEIREEFKKDSEKDEKITSANQEFAESLSSIQQKLAELKAWSAMSQTKFVDSVEQLKGGFIHCLGQQVSECLKIYESNVQELELSRSTEFESKCNDKLAILIQTIESNLEIM